jgi:hypothetical protein
VDRFLTTVDVNDNSPPGKKTQYLLDRRCEEDAKEKPS